MRTIRYFEAIHEAQSQMLEADSDVLLMGLGVPGPTGIFGTTSGLQERFGPDRVIDTPSSENAMTGVALGAAIRGKRPIMGEIASRLADTVIVTDDNPRSEEPATIRAQIMAAARGATEIGDRAQAIGEAVAMLGKGDCLVVAGKGHETGQTIGGVTHPFSDHEVLRNTLAAAGGKAA